MLKILVIISSVVNSLYIPTNEYKYIVPKKIYRTELNSIFNKNKKNIKKNKKYTSIKNNYTNKHPIDLNYQIMNNSNKKVNKKTTSKEICLTVKKLVFLFFIVIVCYFLQMTTSIYNFLIEVTNSTNNF